ncbi:hypothetical protein I302_100115 [Kwoniella bestiolae CBS 10118]|uniref:Diphthine--ammonia ligase n=1 Tax=Kwoniella bestiolae CBS 10118 TaxID=1296100 RepID=A0A1B9G4A3_9TREE|nr:cytoplasmic protein [Kwoniella bestiolae CBS 10118]OCF25818.1 cytoplasmic protein [Kwoniella bestiolae CBS 10118]
MASSSTLPGVKHKVIGLVSGGKDSCFNLMHCVANGHEIVALSTLTPEPGVDELDSHLYQSVGTHLLPLIAKAMDLPLYTRVIKGKAVSKGAEYGSRLKGGEGSGEKGDETEDLTELLKEVMSAHPEATALSSGAILSTYQRLRIEHVCSRLNLVSLAYLWQSQQMPLLHKMLECEMEVVLMKVAGVGLGTKVVGKQLGEIMPLLTRLEQTYGSHPAGEGGEYETLTLSTPLFSHRLRLTKTNTVITDPEPYPVAYLKVEDAELEAKEGWIRPTVQQLREMLGLDQEVGGEEGVDEENLEILEELRGDFDLQGLTLEDKDSTQNIEISHQIGPVVGGDGVPRFKRKGRWFCISVDGVTRNGEDVGEELKGCFDAISDTLKSHDLSLPLHSTHITLLLSSMSLFLPANAAYKTYFGTSPPSRATVAVPLQHSRVRIEVVGFDDAPLNTKEKLVGDRNALHVQSLSYWAPANIGPYSQAVMVNQRIHLAGQIPLLPSSLTLPNPPCKGSPYPHQAVLAVQHVGRIIDVLKSRNYTGGGWEGWIESCVGWWARPSSGDGGGTREAVGVVKRGWEMWVRKTNQSQVPVLFVQALELPKSALVEYQVNVHTGRRGVDPSSSSTSSEASVDDDEDEDENLKPSYTSGLEESQGVWWELYGCSGRNQGSRGVIFGLDVESISRISAVPTLTRIFDKAVTIRIYHLPNIGDKLSSFASSLKCNYTLIPVYSIHDKNGKEATVGLEIFGV